MLNTQIRADPLQLDKTFAITKFGKLDCSRIVAVFG